MALRRTKTYLPFCPLIGSFKVLCLGLFIFVILAQSGVALARTKRIAVMPFENFTQRPQDNWLRDAYSESLNDHFSHLKKVVVIPRKEINQACEDLNLPVYLPFDEKLAFRIAKKLDAHFIIIGSFRYKSNRLVAFSRIVSGKKGQILHSYRQRGEAPKNFRFFAQVQDIAHQFLPAGGVSKRKLEKAKEAVEPAARRTQNFKSFEFFIKARLAFYQGGAENYYVATKFYRQAIKRDYKFGLAYIGMAEALTFWGFYRKTHNQNYQDKYQKAHSYLLKAKKYMKILPKFHVSESNRLLDADINFVVGETHLKNKQYPQAIAAYRQNLRLTPKDAMTLFRIGEAYRGMGEFQRARNNYISALEKNSGLIPAIDRLEELMAR